MEFNISQSQLRQLNRALEQHIVKETNSVAEELYNGIKRDTPVATGRAQAGWEFVPMRQVGESAVIGNDVEYVKYLEFGTAFQDPRRFVQRNIKDIVARHSGR